jgi:4-amino-4-deoxy-L-arabinose transferase-like glycosyltransferase
VLVSGFNNLLSWASIALAVFALFASVDAAIHREDAYRAVDKKTKPFWLIILGVATGVIFFLPLLSFLPIIALIAVIVYMVDVRPALRNVSGRGGPRRGGGKSSSDGPYGPFRR